VPTPTSAATPSSVDDHGRERNVRTIATTTAAHLDALCRAQRLDEGGLWAIEDWLERDLLVAGGRIVRVPPS